jgi:hypothetical protein
MSYFDLAVALTRAEAAPTLAKMAQKSIALKTIRNRAQETCCCSAYSFPHRAGSGWCPGVDRAEERGLEAERTREEINAEELALFDRAEARAINSRSW